MVCHAKNVPCKLIQTNRKVLMFLDVILLTLSVCQSEVNSLPNSSASNEGGVHLYKEIAQDTKAVEYLERYGYLSRRVEEDLTHSQVDRDHAVRTFQKFANVTETGVIDNETSVLMSQPRCGFVDILPNTDRTLPLKLINPAKWETKVVKWKITTYSKKLSTEQQRQAMVNSFGFWSASSGLILEETKTNSFDIEIRFVSGDHGDGRFNAFDGRGKSIAHAFLPPNGAAHFDEAEDWTYHSNNGTELEMTAIHELGHSLGLIHSTARESIMAPFYKKYRKGFKLHPIDVFAIQELYGPPMVKQPRAPSKTPNNSYVDVTNITDKQPINKTSDTQSIKNSSDIQPINKTSDIQPINKTSDIQPIKNSSDIQPINKTSYIQPINKTSDKQPINKTGDIQPTNKTSDIQPINKTSDIQSFYKANDKQQINNTANIQPINNSTYTQPINNTSDKQLSNNGTHKQRRRKKHTDICTARFDAICGGKDGHFNLFVGRYVYKLYSYCQTGHNCIVEGYPRLIRAVYAKGPKRVHAAAYIPDVRKRTYLFKGRKLWRYTGSKLDEGYPIKLKSNDLPYKPSAAYIQKTQYADYQLYLFNGKHFWEMNLYTNRIAHSTFITNTYWSYMPKSPDAMIQTKDGNIYVFKGKFYRKYDYRRDIVSKKNPKAPAWIGRPCGFGDKNQYY